MRETNPIPVAGLLLLVLATCFPHGSLADPSLHELERSGNQLLLKGDFKGAGAIQARLIDTFEEPAGHVFALNTIVTQLTWDETQTRFDEALQDHAATTLAWCEPRLKGEHALMANYYCGQAYFALAYYNGLRGNYYQAGKQGTRCIDHLETALTINGDLVDARMHLGIAYHVADNLPPFIRMFSRLLWFIPSGNSEKSLPYLLDVIERGDQYRDVARYIYSIVLLEDPDLRREAEHQLRQLVSLYPQNRRFQLRLISVLMILEDYPGTLRAATSYLESDFPLVEPDASLAKIWMVRAYLGLNQPGEAARIFAEIDPVFDREREALPGWSLAWHMLTDGQLHDIAHRRREAQAAYARIIKLAKSTYVNENIIKAARAGLTSPYHTMAP